MINSEHRNADYFPTIALPEALRAVSDPQAAMDGADFVVLAVPSQSLRANLATWQIPPDAVVVSLAKGIELGTGLRMSQVIAEAGAIAADRIAVVTGPNLAREIAERQPSASVVASVVLDTAEALQVVCHTPRFRAYTNTDVIGCELAGATKNVIALAVGMAIGLGLGANATASVITRGLAETGRLGAALGADPYTFSGLAGLGRPGRHLLVPAVAEPHLRRGTRPGAYGRRDHRLHPPGRRRSEVVRLDPGTGRGARYRDADRRARGRRDRRHPDPGRDDHRPDVPLRQARALLTL